MNETNLISTKTFELTDLSWVDVLLKKFNKEQAGEALLEYGFGLDAEKLRDLPVYVTVFRQHGICDDGSVSSNYLHRRAIAFLGDINFPICIDDRGGYSGDESFEEIVEEDFDDYSREIASWYLGYCKQDLEFNKALQEEENDDCLIWI